MDYSVVVPAYNEGENIRTLVIKLHRQLKKTKKSFEIIIVDDNSTDNTREVLNKLKKNIKELRPIHRNGNKGVGNSIREGLSKAKGTFIITLDGDLSHDPDELPIFLHKIKSCDMVCGSRYLKGGKANMNLSRKVISGIFNFTFRKLIGLPIKDFTSGYRLYKRKIVDSITLNSIGFGIYIEIPIKAHLAGFRLREVPITYHRRDHGTSNLSYLKQGPEYLKVAVGALKMLFFHKKKRNKS